MGRIIGKPQIVQQYRADHHDSRRRLARLPSPMDRRAFHERRSEMTRGRKGLPVQIHKLRGTFRPDRHNADAPAPAPGLVPAPAHLDKTGKQEYRRAGKLLLRMRTLTPADMAGLACYAAAWSRLIEAQTKLRETGLVIKSPAGFPCISPYLSIVRQATEELRKWSSELGLTPASRTKLKAAPEDFSSDPMQKFLSKIVG